VCPNFGSAGHGGSTKDLRSQNYHRPNTACSIGTKGYVSRNSNFQKINKQKRLIENNQNLFLYSGNEFAQSGSCKLNMEISGKAFKLYKPKKGTQAWNGPVSGQQTDFAAQEDSRKGPMVRASLGHSSMADLKVSQ
jgi:hypothetical protein